MLSSRRSSEKYDSNQDGYAVSLGAMIDENVEFSQSILDKNVTYWTHYQATLRLQRAKGEYVAAQLQYSDSEDAFILLRSKQNSCKEAVRYLAAARKNLDKELGIGINAENTMGMKILSGFKALGTGILEGFRGRSKPADDKHDDSEVNESKLNSPRPSSSSQFFDPSFISSPSSVNRQRAVSTSPILINAPSRVPASKSWASFYYAPATPSSLREVSPVASLSFGQKMR